VTRVGSSSFGKVRAVMRNRWGGRAVAVALMLLATLSGADRVSADHDVEHRIAQFWQRVDALQPGDYLSAGDVGQWALNVIERDPRTRITVADFRASAAGLQAAFDRAGPAPVAATPAPATPAPAPGTFTFGAGKKIVPTEVPPATYRTRTAAAGCYWERLSGLGGTFGEIITNDNTDGPAVVTIASSDKGFNSSRCATWTADLSAITQSPSAPFGTGTYIVGVDIAAGTWRSSGGTTWYWERISSFDGGFGSIIANDNAADTTVVTIAASDKGFKSSRCGTWTKI